MLEPADAKHPALEEPQSISKVANKQRRRSCLSHGGPGSWGLIGVESTVSFSPFLQDVCDVRMLLKVHFAVRVHDGSQECLKRVSWFTGSPVGIRPFLV